MTTLRIVGRVVVVLLSLATVAAVMLACIATVITVLFLFSIVVSMVWGWIC